MVDKWFWLRTRLDFWSRNDLVAGEAVAQAVVAEVDAPAEAVAREAVALEVAEVDGRAEAVAPVVLAAPVEQAVRAVPEAQEVPAGQAAKVVPVEREEQAEEPPGVRAAVSEIRI